MFRMAPMHSPRFAEIRVIPETGAHQSRMAGPATLERAANLTPLLVLRHKDCRRCPGNLSERPVAGGSLFVLGIQIYSGTWRVLPYPPQTAEFATLTEILPL